MQTVAQWQEIGQFVGVGILVLVALIAAYEHYTRPRRDDSDDAGC